MAFKITFRAINSLKNYKGVTLLRTYSLGHFENGTWEEGGDCQGQCPLGGMRRCWRKLFRVNKAFDSFGKRANLKQLD